MLPSLSIIQYSIDENPNDGYGMVAVPHNTLTGN
jgi:hypothetical protein